MQNGTKDQIDRNGSTFYLILRQMKRGILRQTAVNVTGICPPVLQFYNLLKCILTSTRSTHIHFQHVIPTRYQHPASTYTSTCRKTEKVKKSGN